MMFGMREVIPFMQKQGGGSIVNCSSIVGLVSGNVPGVAYSASKGAIRSMSRQIAQQFAKDRIRVNSIYPGTITNGIILANKNNMPLPPYVGEPIDVAYGYLYLASDESKFVTGTELVIDGGWFAK
jgi:NAD(P)-dependent dehydrogenase (short-subunit alcohol dehydrogenase family)